MDERARPEPVEVSDLRPETIEGVAARLLESSTFEELIYRESEMDALFSLADIAISTSRRGNVGTQEELEMRLAANVPQLAEFRTLVFAAHDLSHEDRVVEAADLLRQAARIASSWSE